MMGDAAVMMRTKIISLFNHKGGVSKTTTTFHLGWMLAILGKRVMIVDTDPQCNLTGMCISNTHNVEIEELYQSGVSNIRSILSPVFDGKPEPLSAANCIHLGRYRTCSYSQDILHFRSMTLHITSQKIWRAVWRCFKTCQVRCAICLRLQQRNINWIIFCLTWVPVYLLRTQISWCKATTFSFRAHQTIFAIWR